MVRIIPRETKFFDLFADVAGNVTDGARLLTTILENFSNVEIQVEKLPDVIHVPAQAVFNKNGQYFVYVQQKDGKFESRPVKLVKQSESMMVIESGVNAGEVVAMADPTPGKDNKKGEKKSSGGAQGAMSGMGGGK